MKNMRALKGASLALSFVFMISCGDPEPVATTYKKGYAADATGTPPVVQPPVVQPPVVQPPVVQPGAGNQEPAAPAGGDATKGAALLTSCTGCHSPGGLASSVKLATAAISRLDNALSGPASTYHGAFRNSFSGTNRLDLEAALKAIP